VFAGNVDGILAGKYGASRGDMNCKRIAAWVSEIGVVSISIS